MVGTERSRRGRQDIDHIIPSTLSYAEFSTEESTQLKVWSSADKDKTR